MIFFLFTINDCSHKHDCPLSIYDLYLQHGNSGIGTTYLMFLAYKSVAQQTSEFFHNLCEVKNFAGIHNYLHDGLNGDKENLPESELSEGQNINQNHENGFVTNHDTIYDDINGSKDIHMESPVGRKEFDGYDIYFNMVTHVDTLSVHEIFERIVTSIFLLNCLEATNYFKDQKPLLHQHINGKEETIGLKERVMFVGLLFHAYSVILSNVFATSEINTTDVDKQLELETFAGIPRSVTGNAMFPRVASMINHSCDPNTTCIYINGKTQVYFRQI